MEKVDASGCVLVPLERLRALEALEAEMPARIAKAAQDLNNAKLTALREKDTPEAARERYKKHYETHKEEINKRRREARAAKKAETGKSPESNASV